MPSEVAHMEFKEAQTGLAVLSLSKSASAFGKCRVPTYGTVAFNVGIDHRPRYTVFLLSFFRSPSVL